MDRVMSDAVRYSQSGALAPGQVVRLLLYDVPDAADRYCTTAEVTSVKD